MEKIETPDAKTLEKLVAEAIALYGDENKELEVKSYVPEKLTRLAVAQLIDHTILGATIMPDEVDTVCHEAFEHGFTGVCVAGSYITHVYKYIRTVVEERGIKSYPTMISVIAFPTGAFDSEVKRLEACRSITAGAEELDMVINLAQLKSKDYVGLFYDIKSVTKASDIIRARVPALEPIPVKVILETGALSREQIIAGCVIAREAGASFVKTSTGFGPGGAREEDVRLMRAVVGEKMGVKASGGIRDWAAAKKMLEAGASRLGASKSVSIIAEIPA